MRRAPGTALDLHYDPAPCASDHTAYWTTIAAPLGGPPEWTGQACGLGAGGTATIDPGPVPPGRSLLLVVVGNDGETEGSYGRDATGTERPAASDLPGCSYRHALAPGCF